ncbi:MAG: Appr-1-p processing protein [Pseudomonadota bacterium]
MHRYLGGLLDPFVTVLEVHKLMYFMQEAGEPLKLRYEKAPHGPYAENLSQMLREAEGCFIVCCTDSVELERPLSLMPGAADEAAVLLAKHPPSRERFDRVASLMEGFESPFGLELLSTVHWVINHERQRSLDDLVAGTCAWNERKRQFTRRQIGIAVDVLTDKAWVSPVSQAST